MRELIANLWKRIRNINLRDLKPWQIALGVIATLLAVYMVFVIIQALFLPLVAMIGLFIAYQFLSSRDEDIPEELKKSKAQRDVDEAIKNVQAVQSGEIITTEADASTDAAPAESAAPADAVQDEDEESDANLIVKQIVNPDTGFKEPDISRLIEREEQKLAEAQKVTDDVMAQIEARRRRLREQQDDGE